MSAELAAKHADELLADIVERVQRGQAFGLRHTSTDEWIASSEDIPEGSDWTDYTDASALDYLQDVLDIEYRVSSTGEYKSAEVLIGFGGPNVWIDTKTSELIVTWWSAPETRVLPAEFIDGIDQALTELWETRA